MPQLDRELAVKLKGMFVRPQAARGPIETHYRIYMGMFTAKINIQKISIQSHSKLCISKIFKFKTIELHYKIIIITTILQQLNKKKI